MTPAPETSPEILPRIFAHADVDPHRAAICDWDRALDYGALRLEVGELAAGLLARGVRPGDRVALHLGNSVDFAVTALAAMWVGAIFVPLAVTDPEARLAVVLDDCDPAVIVTGVGEDAYPGPCAVSAGELRVTGAVAPAPVRDPDRPVYAIYTSGTTGTPKGVLVGQRALVAAGLAQVEATGLDAGDRTLCVLACHFDGSFVTLFAPLMAGGLVVVPPRDSLLFPRALIHTMVRHDITYVGFSPSYLHLLLSSPHVSSLAATPLRLVGVGGEVASRADIEALRALVPQIRVFNWYGPTETTIAVTNHEVRPAAAGTAVPIGGPNPGTTFVLVDNDGVIVEAAGEVGELYIGGPQVMLGYWGAPVLSASVLRTDIVAGATLYRSGDLVVRNGSGEYFYLDRVDRVIKRNGVRISLVELTEVLRGIEGVTSASAALFDDGGRFGIAAFVTTVDGALTAEEIRHAALVHLPTGMIPDRVVVVVVLPLTPAGKVDHRRLLSDAGLGPAQTRARVA